MKIIKILISLLLVFATNLYAQEKAQVWNLDECINYALKNNIQIQKSKITLEQNAISTKQAKAQLFPDLSASVGQNYTNHPTPVKGGSTNNYTGSYGLNSSMLLFDGGKTKKNIEQQKLTEKASEYDVQGAEKDIQLSILQIYLQILYANESVNINKSTLAVSEFQLKRGESMLKAGSISKVDLAQLESQYSSDKYQIVVAENSLKSLKLQMKQLLELGVNDELDVSVPTLNELDVLKALPQLKDIYARALNVMPQLKSSKLNIEIAEKETQKAKTGYLPKINLNASIGTNNSTESIYNELGKQLQDGLNEQIGLSVSIPIYNKRETKSAIEKAKLSEKTTQLALQETEKSLLKEIESAYNDATSAQSQYSAALEKVKSLQTSYELIEKQYNLGLKNTLDLLTEKNNLLSAKQNMSQAKYLSIMNTQVLNIYQELPIEIK